MNQSRTIRLPVHVVKEINLVLRALRHLELANGREIHLEQVAHLIDRPIEEVRRALALNEHISSLDAPLEIDPNHTVADAINPAKCAILCVNGSNICPRSSVGFLSVATACGVEKSVHLRRLPRIST